MTTIYGDQRESLNVTLVECESHVSLIRTEERDGYDAIQIEMQKTKKTKVQREFKIEKSDLKIGDNIGVEIFSVGDVVKVSGTTKAKGFQGGVKRHGFKGGPKSHGHKHDLRAPGSIGATTPQHVMKGRRMAGRMGGERSTSMNLKVVFIDKDKKLIGVKGAVPGIPGTVIEIYNN